MSICRLGYLRRLFLFSVLCWGIALPAHAVPILTPTGLNPGDTYQLAFVTSTTRNALSTVIGDYNTFVQGTADAAGIGLTSLLGPIMWNAIGSTATVAARDNAVVSTSVYNLGDQLVATDFTDMWDGSLLAPILLNENGDQSGAIAWTGSASDGFQSNVLGNIGSSTTIGNSGLPSSGWIDTGVFPSSSNQPLYALSTPLTVPQTPIPEPSTMALMGTGFAALASWRWRQRKPSVE